MCECRRGETKEQDDQEKGGQVLGMIREAVLMDTWGEGQWND